MGLGITKGQSLSNRGADASVKTTHVVEVTWFYCHLCSQSVLFDRSHSQPSRTVGIWPKNAVKVLIDIRMFLQMQRIIDKDRRILTVYS